MSKIQYEVKRRLRIYQNLMLESDQIKAAYEDMIAVDDSDIIDEGEEEDEGEGETTTGEVLETLDPIPNAIDATTFVIDGEEFITVTTTMVDSYSDSWNGDVQAKFTNIITGEVYYIAIGPEFDIEVVSVQLPQGTYGIYMSGSDYKYSSENSMTVMFGEETLLEIPQGTFPAVPGLYYGQTSEGEDEGGEGGGGEGEGEG